MAMELEQDNGDLTMYRLDICLISSLFVILLGSLGEFLLRIYCLLTSYHRLILVKLCSK